MGGRHVPTYDSLPSYDDEYERADRPSGSSSEGMIPADIWEEIAGLARGRLPEPTPTPEPEPAPEPVEYLPRRSVERIPARPVETHRVHRAHAGYGTDPSSREALGAGRPRSAAVGQLSRDARTVRRQLRGGAAGALRQAVILQEVLGPPAAMRSERFPEE